MIASVRGNVQSVSLDSAVIDVGGLGFLVQATPATLAALRVGQAVALDTSMVVREDSLTLYGFADGDEREVFEIVRTVSGVGPRIAMAMLAVHTPEGLRRAVAGEDLAALMRVPGIGRKGAQRLVLELADRLGPPTGSGSTEGNGGRTAARTADRRGQVAEALVGLGWSARPAEDAVAAVVGAGPGPTTDAEVAALLRAALAKVSGVTRG